MTLLANAEKGHGEPHNDIAFAKATSTADKELFMVPGATHIRTYLVEEYVSQISAKLKVFSLGGYR